MNHLKRLLCLGLSLALLCGILTVPALAAGKSLYLNGYSETYFGTRESSREGQLSVTSDSELKAYGTVTYSDWTASVNGKKEPFRCPVYYSEGPVTVKLTAGVSKGSTSGSAPHIISLGVDEMRYDAGKKHYSLVSEDAAVFDGSLAYAGEKGLVDAGSIADYVSGGKELPGTPCFYRGAAVTLSQPGVYRVYAYYGSLTGGCEVYLWIEPSASSNEIGEGKPTDFTDVSAGAYYADAVAWAVDEGITGGTSPTTFTPNAPCNRGQVVTFLWRAQGKPEPKTQKNPFTDVSESSYYYKAVLWAYENGITGGTSPTTFSPGTPCTRAQVVTFLWRTEKKPSAPAGSSFNDVSAGAYYATAVAWAVDEGITGGTTPATFSPDRACTRAQVVTFLYRDMAK
jgi:hypothetical protein